MNRVIVMMLVCCSASAQAQVDDARGAVEMIESLQHDIKDFRCEFEGKLYYLSDEVRKLRGLQGEGLYDTFSGLYVWKTGGDTYVDSLHRFEPEGKIVRETLIVRPREKQAEVYSRPVDAPLGEASLQDSSHVNANRTGSLGELFLIDEIKRDAARDGLELVLSDDEIDGRPLKVLTFRLKGVDQVFDRFWVDLRRSGHVVRRESYGPKNAVVGRVDIKLASFRVGSAEVWMPIFGKAEGHMTMKDGKPFISPEPTSSETIYINDGTLRFNLDPGPGTFTHTYKPGTPISDSLRRVQTEFGHQKPPARQTKLQVETMLREQLATAQAQRKELVAGSPARPGTDLVAWLPWVFGLGLIIGSAALLRQNSRRRG